MEPMKTQLPPVVWQAIILECESSPYVLGTFLSEQAALDRLDVCKRSLNPNCMEEFWMWVETVENGTVVNRRDVMPLAFDSNQIAGDLEC